MLRIYVFAAVVFLVACSNNEPPISASDISSPEMPAPPVASSSGSTGSSSEHSSSDNPASNFVPPAPQNLQAEVIDKQVAYHWNPVPAASEYILYYSSEPGVAPSDTSIRWVRTQTEGVVMDGYEDVYYAVVTAVASNGVESAPSKQIQAAIGAKPVFSLDFENEPLGQYELRTHSETPDLSVKQDSITHTRYLSATYIPNNIGSARLQFMREFSRGEEYTLSYQVLFENKFDFAKGGKLPGLGPRIPVTGCASRDPAGWSVRLMWLPNGRIGLYYYDQQPVDKCGSTTVAQNFQFKTGRWYDISLYVKLNSGNLQNGQIALYVDGVKIASRDNVKLRSTDNQDSQIQKLLFDTFFGGSSPEWAPSTTVKSRFDQIEIYRGLRVRTSPVS